MNLELSLLPKLSVPILIIIISLVVTFILTQLTKFFTHAYKYKEFKFKKFVEGGGMPSSHTSLVTALTVSIFLTEGFSTLFIIAGVFSVIVIRDAMGIRSYVGEQAKQINFLMKNSKINNLFKTNKTNTQQLKEVVGHSSLEVFVGVIYGLVIPFIVWLILLGFAVY